MTAAVLLLTKEVTGMDKFTFGFTMLVVGMGGTLLTLGIMSGIMTLLKKIFPLNQEKNLLRSSKEKPL